MLAVQDSSQYPPPEAVAELAVRQRPEAEGEGEGEGEGEREG